MTLRHFLLGTANLLLLLSLAVTTWRAHTATPDSVTLPARAGEPPTTLALASGDLLTSPAMTGIYFAAGMFAVAMAAGIGLHLAARKRPQWLTLPRKQTFVQLPEASRKAVISTVRDYLLVVCTLCVGLIAFVQWQALGAATGAWGVPFAGENSRAALLAGTVVFLFVIAATVLFAREYFQRIEEAAREMEEA